MLLYCCGSILLVSFVFVFTVYLIFIELSCQDFCELIWSAPCQKLTSPKNTFERVRSKFSGSAQSSFYFSSTMNLFRTMATSTFVVVFPACLIYGRQIIRSPFRSFCIKFANCAIVLCTMTECIVAIIICWRCSVICIYALLKLNLSLQVFCVNLYHFLFWMYYNQIT